jgi:hypothetical protein
MRQSTVSPLLIVAFFIAVGLSVSGNSWARQLEGLPPGDGEEEIFDEYPTVEGVLQAHRQGRSGSRIASWIRHSGAWLPLQLDKALQLRTEGISYKVLAAMTNLPVGEIDDLLSPMGRRFVVGEAGREGLGERRLLKMVRQGAPEEEILAAIEAEGSKASLSLDQALDLKKQGSSTDLIFAIGRGALEPVTEPDRSVAATEEVPLLDDLLAGSAGEEEMPLLDDLLDEEEEGSFFDEFLDEEIEPTPVRQLLVLSDAQRSQVLMAPANIRPADLLRLSRPEGRTPARVRTPPGSFFVLVEKMVDSFDREMIPALRTVHDGDGVTRTLIESGQILYDVDRCCLPTSLTGDFLISRISEDQQGALLGDEFFGLPPYLWDGNRYLILIIDGGMIQRVIKVYEIRKAIGEGRTLVATFIPSSHDPLAVEPSAADDRVTESALNAWIAPNPGEFNEMAKIYGIPPSEAATLQATLSSNGKAVWKDEGIDGSVTLVTFSLDTFDRTRVEKLTFLPEGPFEMLTRQAERAGQGSRNAEPPTLPVISRSIDKDLDLPAFVVGNSASSPAFIQLGDGTAFVVNPGQTREVTVGPGSYRVEARYVDAPGEALWRGVHFSYHSRYRLQLSR